MTEAMLKEELPEVWQNIPAGAAIDISTLVKLTNLMKLHSKWKFVSEGDVKPAYRTEAASDEGKQFVRDHQIVSVDFYLNRQVRVMMLVFTGSDGKQWRTTNVTNIRFFAGIEVNEATNGVVFYTRNSRYSFVGAL